MRLHQLQITIWFVKRKKKNQTRKAEHHKWIHSVCIERVAVFEKRKTNEDKMLVFGGFSHEESGAGKVKKPFREGAGGMKLE
jgi:hypothetical protein